MHPTSFERGSSYVTSGFSVIAAQHKKIVPYQLLCNSTHSKIIHGNYVAGLSKNCCLYFSPFRPPSVQAACRHGLASTQLLSLYNCDQGGGTACRRQRRSNPRQGFGGRRLSMGKPRIRLELLTQPVAVQDKKLGNSNKSIQQPPDLEEQKQKWMRLCDRSHILG